MLHYGGVEGAGIVFWDGGCRVGGENATVCGVCVGVAGPGSGIVDSVEDGRDLGGFKAVGVHFDRRGGESW